MDHALRHLRPLPPPDVRRAGLRVREAEPRDELGLVALLARSSARSRYRRFHGAGDGAIRRELTRIAHPTAAHRSWVAVAGGDLVGTATLALDRDGAAEAAFLVEDDWARRGVGRRLFAALAVHARRLGLPEVIARARIDNPDVRGFLRALAPGARTRFAGAGEVDIVVRVPAVPPAAPARPVLVPPPVPVTLTAESA